MPIEVPSFEERCDNNQFPLASESTRRLLWYIQGPSFEDQVLVMNNSSDPAGPRQPYAQNLSPGGPRWHDISQEPLTIPAVSSVTVQSRELENHPHWWASEAHRHADPDFDFCIYGEEDENGTRKLLRCCGEDRPQEHIPLVVTAATQPFVTIHDYITTIHPWIFSLREEILVASLNRPEDNSKLVLNYNGLSSVAISSEEDWTSMKRAFSSDAPPNNPSNQPPTSWHAMFA